MRNLNLTLVPLGIVLLVAGCGGGGGSSGGGAVPTAAIQITSSNSPTVVAGANSSTNTLTSTATTRSAPTSPTGIVASSSAASLHAIESAISGFASVRNLSIPVTATAVVNSVSLDICSSGTATGSWNDADDSTALSVGDSLSVSYNTCRDRSDSYKVKNGQASFTINSDGFSLNYTSYSEESASETLTMNGDLKIATSDVSGLASISMTGTSLETNSSVNGHFMMWGPGIAFSAASAGAPYSTVITHNSNTSTYTYGINLSAASTEMGGSVSIITNPAFSFVGTANPLVGTMTITGSGGSHLTLAAHSPTQYAVSGTDGTTAFGPTYYDW